MRTDCLDADYISISGGRRKVFSLRLLFYLFYKAELPVFCEYVGGERSGRSGFSGFRTDIK